MSNSSVEKAKQDSRIDPNTGELIIKQWLDNIDSFVEVATYLARTKGWTFWFMFNGTKCHVNPGSKTEYLSKDYINSSYMKEKEIGPYYAEKYGTEYEKKLNEEKDKREKARIESAKRLQIKREQLKKKVLEEIGYTTLHIKHGFYEDYLGVLKTNSGDNYSKRTIEFANQLGCLCQVRLDRQLAWDWDSDFKQAVRDADYDDLSGAMYSFALSVLKQFWEFGDEIKS